MLDIRIEFFDKILTVNAGVSASTVGWKEIQEVLINFGSKAKSASTNSVIDSFKRKLAKPHPSREMARVIKIAIEGYPENRKIFRYTPAL